MMGKKAVKKIKELSVAISESTSTTEAQDIITTPRKRGRPRKVIEKQEEKTSQTEFQEEDDDEKEKKLKEISKEVMKVSSSITTEEGKFEEKEFPRRSRARKKSKPRKTS